MFIRNAFNAACRNVLFHCPVGQKEVGLNHKWIWYLMNNEKLVDTMFEQDYEEPEIGA